MAGGTSAQSVNVLLAVETNFVIGVIWEKRPVLVRIFQLCKQFGALLVVPEISLAEARNSLIKRLGRKMDAIHQFRFWLNDISRGANLRPLVSQLRRNLDDLENELRQRQRSLLEGLEAFARSVTVASITPQIWTRAYVRWKASLPPFKELDCLVFETLMDFLRRHKAPLTMFLTIDAEDFDHPEIHEAFRRRKALMLLEPRDVIVEFRKFYGVA